jgi:hypothetical protein
MADDLGEAGPTAPGPDEREPVTGDSTPEPLRELTLGRSPASARPIGPSATTRIDSDIDELQEIRRRCLAKCDALRWQVESHRRLWEGVEAPIDDAHVDRKTIEWSGRMVDNFYWLNEQSSSETTDVSLLEDVGGCFQALAEAIRLMPGGEAGRGKLERSLPLIAEAQSMLRKAIHRLQAPNDPDQLAAFRFARDAAARNHIFVKRHLKADDPADPSDWPGLLSRIEALAGGGTQSRQQRQRIGELRGVLESIRRGNAGDQGWQALIDLVEQALEEGLPPSNRDLRELLLPVIDEIPDREDMPPGFRLVLREIDQYLATRTRAATEEPGYAPPAEVIEATRLLEGRSVVLIGGIRRREAQEALRRALNLKDLIWIETREHQSIDPFEPVVARPEVALVLLAIRWSSHAFGDVRQFCVRHDKPLVRLPGGYGPHQVAVQVLAQASDWLKRDDAADAIDE